MNSHEIAKVIVTRQNRMSQAIMPGELQSDIGAEAMQEALNNRWIVPDVETGFLHVTTDFGTLAEIRKLAEEQEIIEAEARAKGAPAPIQESVVETTGYPWQTHAFHESLGTHMQRRHSISEIAAPGTGNAAPPPSTSSRPVTPMAPASHAPPPSPSNPSSGADIGDDVMVTENGKTFTGKIHSRDSGGNYQLTFGDQKPMANRPYKSNEVRLVQKAVAAPQV